MRRLVVSPTRDHHKEYAQVWQSISYYAALAVESLIGVFGIRLYEEARYDVIDRIGDRVEIRRYVPRLAAEVDLAVPGGAGRSEAFKLLFAYIAGANRASVSGNDRIAMTVPVEVSGKERLAMTVPVQTSETNGTLKMRFFLPAKYSRENAPKPLNLRVRLVTTSDETRRSCWDGHTLPGSSGHEASESRSAVANASLSRRSTEGRISLPQSDSSSDPTGLFWTMQPFRI